MQNVIPQLIRVNTESTQLAGRDMGLLSEHGEEEIHASLSSHPELAERFSTSLPEFITCYMS